MKKCTQAPFGAPTIARTSRPCQGYSESLGAPAVGYSSRPARRDTQGLLEFRLNSWNVGRLNDVPGALAREAARAAAISAASSTSERGAKPRAARARSRGPPRRMFDTRLSAPRVLCMMCLIYCYIDVLIHRNIGILKHWDIGILKY